jgi:alpha-beta hydrolase superfamily lysophospholipase
VPRGYNVYAFDLRGHGRSQGTRGALNTFGEFREDVGAFLELVRESEQAPIFLAGHSLGGLIVLDYALHKGSGLTGVVASGPVLSPPGISPFLLWLSKVLDRVWPSLILESGLDTSALSRDAAVVEAYVNDPLVHSKGSARLANEMLRAVQQTQAHAAELALPCLIVHGSEDRLCDPQASKLFYDNVTFAKKERIEYEGYYHEVFNEPECDRVLQDVEDWLEAQLDA